MSSTGSNSSNTSVNSSGFKFKDITTGKWATSISFIISIVFFIYQKYLCSELSDKNKIFIISFGDFVVMVRLPCATQAKVR